MKHRKKNSFWTVAKGVLLFYFIVFIGILVVERQLDTLTYEAPALRLEVERYVGIAAEKAVVSYDEGTDFAVRIWEEFRRQGWSVF